MSGGRRLSDGWIDVSAPLREGLVHWPGDPPLRVTSAASIAAGADANVTHLDMGAHTGTHMDAPAHFIEAGAGIDALPLGTTIGPARLIGVDDGHEVTAETLRRAGVRQGERLLLKTRNSRRDWTLEEFDRDFVALSVGAAQHLAEVGVGCVGVDYLSVGGIQTGTPVHRALLEAGVWVIEGLWLMHVEPGDYELICLPLRLVGRDGAPARALLRPLESRKVH